MSAVGVIGGTGMTDWPALRVRRKEPVSTPYGKPSANLIFGTVGRTAVVFLPRHGERHRVPPHKINYRANLWALQSAGACAVIAVSAVGGIARSLSPGEVAVPHDLVDYTWGRDHTYADGIKKPLVHIEFTKPYDPELRAQLLAGGKSAEVRLVRRGVMGVTQGPRLETPAEIHRLKSDGCTMVGMTGMPEAALARELGLPYATLAVSVNWAAGLGTGSIHGEIESHLATGMARVRKVLARALPSIARAGAG